MLLRSIASISGVQTGSGSREYLDARATNQTRNCGTTPRTTRPRTGSFATTPSAISTSPIPRAHAGHLRRLLTGRIIEATPSRTTARRLTSSSPGGAQQLRRGWVAITIPRTSACAATPSGRRMERSTRSTSARRSKPPTTSESLPPTLDLGSAHDFAAVQRSLLVAFPAIQDDDVAVDQTGSGTSYSVAFTGLGTIGSSDVIVMWLGTRRRSRSPLLEPGRRCLMRPTVTTRAYFGRGRGAQSFSPGLHREPPTHTLSGESQGLLGIHARWSDLDRG